MAITGGPSYTTLQACRSQLMDTVTGDDQVLADFIPVCSQAIEDACGYNFDIRIEQHDFDGEIGLGNATLFLDAWPLLNATSVINGDGTVIPLADIQLLPKSRYPKQSIRLLVNTVFWLTPSGTVQTVLDRSYSEDAVSVVGEYGFNRFYPNAWPSSGLKVQGAMDAVTTTLILSIAAGTKLDVGHVLKVDTEYMLVTDPVLATATQTSLTVIRAYNGSTAASHSDQAVIYRYRVEPVMEEATRMLVAASYRARLNPTGEVSDAATGGVIAVSDFPKKVRDKLTSPYTNPFRGNF